MKPPAITLAALVVCAASALAQTEAEPAASAEAPSFGGTLRAYAEADRISGHGPLAQAHVLQPAIALPADSAQQLDLTLTGRWRAFSGSVTALAAHDNQGNRSARLRLDEASYAAPLPGQPDWQLTLGKKVVAWDIGYAFRPNDLVQQEARRPLVERTLEGRPLAMAERFDADTAWALVAYRKEARAADAQPLAPSENMLAARYYQRVVAADWHGYAGWGTASRGSLGASFSWVTSEAVELHGSARRVARVPQPLLLDAPALAQTPPYASTTAGANQVLLGMTWTGESKLSLLAEAWYDGSAPSDDFWQRWGERNQGIAQTLARVLPQFPNAAPAGAGNLGWQAQALGGRGLRRSNLFARLSWKYEDWEPTADVLYTPADGGLVATAALAWQGERWRLEGGVRGFGGASRSLYAQLPIRALAYLGATLPF